MRGRGYYLQPAYPVLYAAGAVAFECVLVFRGKPLRFGIRSIVFSAMLVDTAAGAWATLPIWRPGTAGWIWQMRNNQDLAEEVGWPEFVAQVAAKGQRCALEGCVDALRVADVLFGRIDRIHRGSERSSVRQIERNRRCWKLRQVVDQARGGP